MVDWEELNDAEMTSEVYTKRFKADEITPVMFNGKFRFPLEEGDLRQPGLKAREVRTRKISKKRKEEREEEIKEEELEKEEEAEAQENDQLPIADDLDKKSQKSQKSLNSECSSKTILQYELDSLVSFVHAMLTMYQTNLYHKLANK